MQTIGYQILFDLKFLLRSLSLIGAVLLILAENRGPANHTVFDLPTLSGDKPKVRFCISLCSVLHEDSTYLEDVVFFSD